MSSSRIDSWAPAWLRLSSLVAAILLAGCGGADNAATGASAAAAAGDKALTVPTGQTGASAGQTDVPTSQTDLATKALTQINATRAVARRCGTVAFAAATAVVWNAKLEGTAGAQAQYMKSTGTLTHFGPGNSTIGDRITAAGYSWSQVGENIAVGYATIEEALQGWIDSPGHCANIMSPNFAVVAVAVNAGASPSGVDQYWAMDLAAP